MEDDFLRVLIVTLVSGLLIAGGGGSLLFLAFRAVGQGPAGERRAVGFSIALLAFIFLCCAVFFILSRQMT
ncbi:MAG TPA: hypothetical protein VM779_15350 [Thermoanaerobaculia bacterium]|nr:hypothetical protein [Thermoanaerobaculia bacterium]